MFRHVSLLPSLPIVHLPETYAAALACFQIRPNCSYSSHDCDIRDLPRLEGDGRGLCFGEYNTPGVPRRDVTPQVCEAIRDL